MNIEIDPAECLVTAVVDFRQCFDVYYIFHRAILLSDPPQGYLICYLSARYDQLFPA